MDIIIDIETVSSNKCFSEMPSAFQKHWEHKLKFLKLTEDEMDDLDLSFFNRAGVYAEFGKIVCIGLGFIDTKKSEIRIKTIYDKEEKTLLQAFLELIENIESESKQEIIFCGHNIKEFDLPFICRRLLAHQLKLPKCLSISGLKPWQINHQDTLEMWKFGDYKHYTSLDLLANVLALPSSKTDMDGSEVSKVFWEEDNLEKIAQYCGRDIFTTSLVYLKLSQRYISDFKPIYI